MKDFEKEFYTLEEKEEVNLLKKRLRIDKDE